MMTTPERTSEEMTFYKLHDGLDDCNCREHEGVRQDYSSLFARLLRNETDTKRVISFRVGLKMSHARPLDFWPVVKSWQRPMLCTGYKQIGDEDFESHHEIPVVPNKDLVDCKDHCQWRGVSINMLLNSNMERIREKYRSIRKHSKARVFGDYLCVFKLLNTAGLVWNDNPSHALQHHNLLKSDSFCVKLVTVVRLEAID